MLTSAYQPTYKTRNSHPGELPSATIYLGGLLCLAFDDLNKNMCTVGVNPADKHRWKLQICERGNPPRTRTWRQDKYPTYNDKDIRIVVTGGTTKPPATSSDPPSNSALVYNGGDAAISTTEGRFNLENTWVDLEGDRGHGRVRILHDANKLRPRFYINDGLFCAYRRSSAKFQLEDKNGHLNKVNKVALAVAADIYLNSSGKIEIFLPDETVRLDPSKKYKIFITNDCEKSCDPDEIDFFLHYGAFTDTFSGRPGKRPPDDRFDMNYQSGESKGDPNPVLSGCDKTPLSDRAPCMTITLGQTRTLT